MNLYGTLVVITAALALQGCVHYYYNYEPPPARESGAWDPYANDPGTPIVDVRIADAYYYPWWSVDYYYFGRHRYRPGYLNGPYYTLGFGPGWGYGAPAFYWPYYGYYSPFYYPYSNWAWYDPWYGWPSYGIGTTITFTSSELHPRLETRYIPPQAGRTLNTVGVTTLADDFNTSLERRRTGRTAIVDGRIGPAPVTRSSRSASPASGPVYTSPVSSASQDTLPAVASPPVMVRQFDPSPGRPVTAAAPASSPAPVTSTPRMVRQLSPSQAQPRMVRPAPQISTPSPAARPAMESAPPSYADNPARQRR